MDTTLPFLWYARQQYPESEITILYCVGNKKQVLRNSVFIDNFCVENRIKQIDLSDLLVLPGIGKRIWKHLFRFSSNDGYPIKSIVSNPRLLFKGKNFFFLGMSIRKRIETYLGNRLINFDKLNDFIKPDIVLFDLRQKTRFYGRQQLFDLLYREKPDTILLPHSPHDITPYSELTSFDEKGEFFPSFCRYWIPFQHSRAFEKFPSRKNDFFYFGYPAFDSTWLKRKKHTFEKKEREKKKCLVMIRNFYEKGMPIPDGEWFTVSYETNIRFLSRLAEAIETVETSIEIIIKPHPKASFPKTRELIQETALQNWQISYESFYEQLEDVDIVISTFTTSLLIPIMQSIPTIVVEDYVQEYVNNWEILSELYQGLGLYTKKEDNLAYNLAIALTSYSAEGDIAHLRKYFPDNNLDMIFKNFRNIIHEKKAGFDI